MEDINKMFLLSRLSLSASGAWPTFDCSWLYKITSKFLFPLSVFFMANVLLIPQTTKIFKSADDIDAVIDILCTADIPISVALLKMLLMCFMAKDIKWFLYKVYEDWESIQSSRQRLIMQDHVEKARKTTAICIGLGYGTPIIFFILRIAMLREKQAKTGKRFFPFEAHFFFNVLVSPWFEVFWCLQCIFSSLASMAYSGFDSFFAVLVIHLCGQFAVLNDELINLTTKDRMEDVQKKIAWIVKRHDELNTFAEKMEDTFNQIFLIQIACLFQFCLQGYQIMGIFSGRLTDSPVLQMMFMTVYMIYMTLDLFIYCYVAETLRTESTRLVEAAYNCNWYYLRPRAALNLILIMKRAQKPLEITVGKFSALSLQLFASIGKTSMAYLSVLLAVNEEK